MGSRSTIAIQTGRQEPAIFHAAVSIPGSRHATFGQCASFRDECFVVSQTEKGFSGGHDAVRHTCETATWAYRHIRQRTYYWDDKKKLLRRIFRTTNMSLFQRAREKQYNGGTAVTLSVVITGQHVLWLGTVGYCPVYLYRDGLIDILSQQAAESSRYSKLLGRARLGIVPFIRSERYVSGDVVVILSQHAGEFITEDELRTVCADCEPSASGVESAAQSLAAVAMQNGATEGVYVQVLRFERKFRTSRPLQVI